MRHGRPHKVSSRWDGVTTGFCILIDDLARGIYDGAVGLRRFERLLFEHGKCPRGSIVAGLARGQISPAGGLAAAVDVSLLLVENNVHRRGPRLTITMPV